MMSSSQQAIAVQDLSKTFGNFVALDKLNFSLNAGQCMGYLGPNGSGKSTTIKILTGLSRPTSGQAFIFGREVGRDTRRALLDVGAVVETPVFPPFLSPVEILAYYGKLRGMSQSEISERSQTVLETVKLGEWARRKIGSFSKGMVQRVALASAMLHDPDLLILDEPTSGLDPRGRVEVREIIKSLVNSGKTILMSTHLLAEAQELCDIIGMLDKGRLLKIDTVQNISRAVEGGKVRIELLSAPTDAQISMIGGLDGVLGVERFGQNSTELVVDHDGGLEGRAQLFKKLGEAGLQVVAFRQAQSSLESYYLSMMPESVD
ncbi:MAG TPA: ABC transporter ATP-binding protein [Nitrososphaera sp.]|nr:ABC transporter ATP-binding protein [Nitrososphaera sp.]